MSLQCLHKLHVLYNLLKADAQEIFSVAIDFSSILVLTNSLK